MESPRYKPSGSDFDFCKFSFFFIFDNALYHVEKPRRTIVGVEKSQGLNVQFNYLRTTGRKVSLL